MLYQLSYFRKKNTVSESPILSMSSGLRTDIFGIMQLQPVLFSSYVGSDGFEPPKA